jgi:hypothetical protein
VRASYCKGYNELKALGYIRDIVRKDGAAGEISFCCVTELGLGQAMVGRNPSESSGS